jgi:hypothetical protein
MNMDAIIKLIDQLARRLDVLEGQWYKFWIPVILSAIAIAISIIAFILNRKQSMASRKQVVLQGVKNNIDFAKSSIEKLSMELAPLKANNNLTTSEQTELDLKLRVYEAAIERLLNAYSDGCDKYFKEQVNRQDFADLYHQDIRDYVEKFPEKFQPPLTRFDKMVRYYEEFHRRARV